MGVTGVLRKTDFPAMQRITELLDIFHKVDYRARAVKFETMAQALRHTEFILKYKNNKQKLGADLWESRADTVKSLNTYLKQNYANKDFGEEYGKDVTIHGQNEDSSAVSANLMQWYRDKAARTQFKLSFRSGTAHRWNFDSDGRKTALSVYDTEDMNDVIEEGMSLYVMDTEGRVYVSGREGEQSLKHSSFLAGGRTLAAGTIRIERGKVKWITGKSGHYQPSVQQMLNVLERLRAFQVDMNSVTVMRENYIDPKFKTTKPRYMEPAPAIKLLSQRNWPGSEAFKMRVG